MGKDWDKDKGGRGAWIDWMSQIAAECLRVLKPGAHALVWAIPRTSHWTATAWEDAGFEVRDRIAHIFGSGFPKSLDVSKAIDKMHGAERKSVGVNQYASRRTGAGKMGTFENRGAGLGGAESSIITAPATEAAKQWEGWGTALKPAVEDWWLLRKPISESSIAANVLRWGTGGVNVDGCRVEGQLDGDPTRFQKTNGGWKNQLYPERPSEGIEDEIERLAQFESGEARRLELTLLKLRSETSYKIIFRKFIHLINVISCFPSS
jgi:site-specific DNA-methyltransferase (adenine-specific)